MSKPKKILFLAHGNNDIDHYLPIISNLNKKFFEKFLFFVPDNNSAGISKFHSHLLKKEKIKIIYSINIISNIFLKFLVILSYKLKKIRLSKIQNNTIYKFFNIADYFVKTLLDFLVSKIENEKNFDNFITKNEFNIAVIDIIGISKEDSKKNFFKYVMFNLVHKLKSKKIPILMISHGAVIRHFKKSKAEKQKNNIKPNLLSVCNSYEIDFYKDYAANKKTMKILGDVRYDYNWIKYLKRENKKFSKNIISNNKIKVLYIMGNLTFINNKIVEKKINEEINNLLTDFSNIELWVKLHPRANVAFRGFKNPNLKIFGNEVDTSLLVELSDIVLSTFSGILTQSIIQKKRTIFYDSWKRHLKNNKTIFDKTPCVKKISNYNDLKQEISKFSKNKKISKIAINQFYKKFISGNTPLSVSIINKYINTINLLLKSKIQA